MNDHRPAEPPVAYRLALWLEDLGVAHRQIAEALDIAPESVEALLEIARRKRARAGAGTEVASGDTDGGLFIGARRGTSHDALVRAARHALTLDVDVDFAVLGSAHTAAIWSGEE